MREKFKCPLCGKETKVASTVQSEADFIRRVRRCLVCGVNFYTVEKFDQFTTANGKQPLNKMQAQILADAKASGVDLSQVKMIWEDENGQERIF